MERCRLITISTILAGLTWFVTPAAAQLPGQASLTGPYYVRYLGVNAVPADSPLSFSGTMTFDGKGGFTVSGQGNDLSTSDKKLKITASGSYTVLSNGMLLIDNPFDSTGNTTLFGGLGQGAIMASSTDTLYCDLLVGVPVSTTATNATLSGNYYLASMEFLNGDFNLTRDTFFSLAANGSGSLGNVTIKGTALNAPIKSTPQTQTSSGATYSVAANGSGTMTFPAPTGVDANSQLLSGAKVLYVSPNGNFFIAGGATSYDLIVGVKSLGGTSPSTALSGLYFQGFLQNYATGSDFDGVYGMQGSVNEVAGGTEVGHQRINWDICCTYDYTYAVGFSPAADGTATYSDSQYAVGAGGNIVIGAGNGSVYQVVFYVKAPDTSKGTGVALNPQGVVNGANSIPFTTSYAPGEVVTLYGSGFAAGPASAAAPFPNILGGVQVMVNGSPAPVFIVSPTLISFVIPYTAPDDGSLLSIQVVNNGTASNTAQVYSGQSAPGIFTNPSGGVGTAAIRHLDGTVVSSTNPAKAGETVSLFMTGLGAVTPPTAAGAPGPSAEPFSRADTPDIFIDGDAASVLFTGLAPGFGGLYQVNLTIPTTVSKGTTVVIEIVTYDADGYPLTDNYEATIPISQ